MNWLFGGIIAVLQTISGQLATIIKNQEKRMADLSQADKDLVAAVTLVGNAVTTGLTAIAAALQAQSGNPALEAQVATDLETQATNLQGIAKQMSDFVATLPAPTPAPAPNPAP